MITINTLLQYKLCFIGNSHIDQFHLDKQYTNIFNAIYCMGASIKGLTNPQSKLQLSSLIDNFQDNNKDYSFVFFLGQVDIEFGYYYKCVKLNNKIDINEYIDDIIDKFQTYLLNRVKIPFYILSINPTVINNIEHNFNVSFRCPNGKEGFYSEVDTNISFEQYKFIYNDSYETRFEYNKLFNDKLEIMCKKNNFRFINLWNSLVKDNKVIDKFIPKATDHHLVTSIYDNLFEKVLDQL